MFRFLFIKRYKKKVLKYIHSTTDHSKTQDDIIRYAFPIESTINPKKTDQNPSVDQKSTPANSCSDRKATESPKSNGELNSNIRYSLRDSFDSAALAAAMNHYMNGHASVKVISSVTRLTFVQKLEQHIRTKKLIEADVYKAALMDRRLFSKIICNMNYKPSKDTALALIFALQLSLSDAQDMLERAGYTLSHSIRRDIIIEYFIKERIYNLNNINAFLYDMNEKIIGRSV